MTPGKFVLYLAWGFSLCFQVTTTVMESTGSTSLVLTVLTLAILGLIQRLDELER